MKNYGHLFDIFEGGLSNPDVNKTFTDVIMFLNSCNKSYQRVKH
jgi:hypothetical protein